jgi:hypothetical protein
LVIEVKTKEGWSASDSGIPRPILQIDVPASVELEGKSLTEYRELSRNEFLQSPFERLLDGPRQTIPFKLASAPGADERISLNVLAYVTDKPGEDAWFARRRLELPLKAGAVATPAATEKSDWGREKLLQIGDKAEPFELPRADGSSVSLAEHLGKKNIVVVTYRAFW